MYVNALQEPRSHLLMPVGPENVPRLVFITLGVIHGVEALTAGSRIVLKAAVNGEWDS
jgi:hypothetical protein